MPPAYRHEVDACLASVVGSAGLSDEELAAALDETRAPLETVRCWHKAGSQPFLTLPARRDDIPLIEASARRYHEAFDSVAVLGTGASSLGGQTLTALVQPRFSSTAGGARVHFVDNVDWHSFDDLLRALNLRRTGFLVISKSGKTPETIAQLMVALAAMGEAVDADRLRRHFTAITGPGESPLRRIAERHGMGVIDHDPKLTGRFAALSAVGLLPAAVAGLDPVAAREGAADVLDATLAAAEPRESAPALGAAVSLALARRRGVACTVLMPYSDRLAPFAQWFRQLWAESLGKAGNFTTPIRAIGTVDQHSQLQLYLDGPRDKMFSFVLVEQAGEGQVIASDRGTDDELAWLAGRTMGDLMEASQRATVETLIEAGRPVRVFRLATLDARALGAMMMHFMLETAIAALVLGINAFDQPAVEAGKIKARRYLEGLAGEGV